jgi:cell wall-associated NlpC family hydrolase
MAVPKGASVRDLGDARLWHASHHRSLERRARAAARRGPRAHTATLAVVVGAGAALAPAAALAAPASGGQVVAAQKALGVDADGVIGPQTRKAIRKFQRSHGLPVTGRLDTATLQALGGGGDGPTTADKAKDRGPGMTLAQGQKALGITADGRMGPKTRAALRSFQSEHGLPATGRFDAATQRALMAGGDSAATPRSAPTTDDGTDTAAPGPASGIQAAIDTARAQIGKPYASGGRGPDGFDCSGLTRYAFKAAGISLGASSFAQYGQGTAVDRSQIQPGDLVFFNTAGSGASHVGVATSATSMISATSHGVMESDFSSGYWGSHYVGARRVGS